MSITLSPCAVTNVSVLVTTRISDVQATYAPYVVAVTQPPSALPFTRKGKPLLLSALTVRASTMPGTGDALRGLKGSGPLRKGLLLPQLNLPGRGLRSHKARSTGHLPPPPQKNASAVQSRASHNERPIYIAREDLLTALQNFATKVSSLLGRGVQLAECFTSLEEELLSDGQILRHRKSAGCIPLPLQPSTSVPSLDHFPPLPASSSSKSSYSLTPSSSKPSTSSCPSNAPNLPSSACSTPVSSSSHPLSSSDLQKSKKSKSSISKPSAPSPTSSKPSNAPSLAPTTTTTVACTLSPHALSLLFFPPSLTLIPAPPAPLLPLQPPLLLSPTPQ